MDGMSALILPLPSSYTLSPIPAVRAGVRSRSKGDHVQSALRCSKPTEQTSNAAFRVAKIDTAPMPVG